jgi:hypothetical protein
LVWKKVFFRASRIISKPGGINKRDNERDKKPPTAEFPLTGRDFFNWISPRRPCPAAPLTGHGLKGSDHFYSFTFISFDFHRPLRPEVMNVSPENAPFYSAGPWGRGGRAPFISFRFF